MQLTVWMPAAADILPSISHVIDGEHGAHLNPKCPSWIVLYNNNLIKVRNNLESQSC